MRFITIRASVFDVPRPVSDPRSSSAPRSGRERRKRESRRYCLRRLVSFVCDRLGERFTILVGFAVVGFDRSVGRSRWRAGWTCTRTFTSRTGARRARIWRRRSGSAGATSLWRSSSGSPCPSSRTRASRGSFTSRMQLLGNLRASFWAPSKEGIDLYVSLVGIGAEEASVFVPALLLTVASGI